MGKNFGQNEIAGAVEKPSLLVLIAVSTVTPLAMQIYLPSLDGMKFIFSASAGEIQLSMSAFFISVAISQLIWGPLSDQLGRRPVIIGGMTLFVLGSIFCLVAPTIETLIAARVIQGAGGCTGLVLARAIVRDLHGPKQAASMIGFVSMGMAVMPTIAPAIGGVLDQFYGWQGGFVLMLLFGLATLWASIFALPETHKVRTSTGPRQVLYSYSALFREPLYWAYSLTAAFLSFTYFAYLGGVPFIAADLMALSPAQMGFYFMFVAIGYMIGNYISGMFAARVGIFRMIFLGALIGALAVAMIAGSASVSTLTPYSLFLPMFVLGLGNGVCLPSAVAGAVSVRPDLTGAASGLTTSLQVGTGAIAGSLVAWLFAGGVLAGSPWAMISVMAVAKSFCLLSVLSVKLITARQQMVPAE